MLPHQLPQETKEQMATRLGDLLSQREEIEFACIHGSFVDSEGGFHDIDIAVWADPHFIDEKQALDYEEGLSAWLAHSITYSLDVKLLNAASLGFKYAASSGTLIFARDPELWYEFREKTWIEYLDFLPLSKQMLFDLLAPS